MENPLHFATVPKTWIEGQSMITAGLLLLILLTAVGIGTGLYELSVYLGPERPFGGRRFLRRGLVSVLLIVLGVMIFYGEMHLTSFAPRTLLHYWGVVMGLVVVLVGMALWDMYDNYVVYLAQQIALHQRIAEEEARRHRDQGPT